MAKLKTSNIKYRIHGFTLIEMLIVLAIFGIMTAAASFMINGENSKVSLQNAQASVINALEKARNQSASGVGDLGTNYGVKITGNKIENFSIGTTNSIGPVTELPPNVTVSGLNEIVFNRLSATSSANATIVISLNGQTATVSVATSGVIDWK